MHLIFAAHFSAIEFGKPTARKDGQEDKEHPATNDCKLIAWQVVEAVGRSRPETG
jgi:hypothetical protein